MSDYRRPAIDSNWTRRKREEAPSSPEPKNAPKAKRSEAEHKTWPTMDDLPLFLTVKDLQQLLRISHNTAYELVHSGEIRAKTVGRQLRIPRSELIRYINS